MYTVARQTSQGNQQCYSTNSTLQPDNFEEVNNMSFTLPRYVRKNKTHYSFEDEEIESIFDDTSSVFQRMEKDSDDDTMSLNYSTEDELEQYHSDNLNTTCYATPSCMDTMRSISS
jgi:hypothetical protein